MNRVLIFGGNGMLGHKLVQGLSSRFETYYTLRGEYEAVQRFGIFDPVFAVAHISAEDPDSIRRAIDLTEPDVVINAIGIVKQVPSAKNVITTLTINSIFPHRLAELGRECGFRLISISTDCVFDGIRGNYSEEDQPNATDLYGKSKNLGEVLGENCLTIRSSIIGRELDSSHSLVEWFLSNRGRQVKGYTQAIYSGFPTVVFTDIIASLISDHKELSGLYHVASDAIDKFRLLGLIDRYFGSGIDLIPSDELKIDRSLDGSRFRAETGFKARSWEEMIELMANDPTPYDTFRK